MLSSGLKVLYLVVAAGVIDQVSASAAASSRARRPVEEIHLVVLVESLPRGI